MTCMDHIGTSRICVDHTIPQDLYEANNDKQDLYEVNKNKQEVNKKGTEKNVHKHRLFSSGDCFMTGVY